MNEKHIEKFKKELESRFENVHDHTEKYDYMEAVEHTLSFLKVNDEKLNEMLTKVNKQIDLEYEAEYGNI